MTDVVATNQTILVVGGGISGMTAAIESAECGKDVILVEKKPSLGGRVSQLYRYFPKLCKPSCGQEINQRRIMAHPKVRVLTMTEVDKIEGEAGNYNVTLKISPRYVNEKCTACGDCAEAVTAEVDDPHNFNMKKHKAAYLPTNMAAPQRYVLDPSIIGTEDAEKAKAACKYDAIDLDMKEESLSLNVGAVIWATGFKPYDAAKIQPYGYDRFDNVITNMEFERLMDPFGPTGGKLLRPSDGKEAKKIAFIQCAGSRDRNHLKHCSRFCCMASLKQTTYLTEVYGDDADASATIYYIDIRAIDRFEDFYQKVKDDKKVSFIKSKVANITQDRESKNPILHGVNTEGYHRYDDEYDLVVLAVGMDPEVKADEIGCKVAANTSGFIDAHADDAGCGIFGAGCATDALDVNRAVQNSTAASLKAIQVINKTAGAEA